MFKCKGNYHQEPNTKPCKKCENYGKDVPDCEYCSFTNNFRPFKLKKKKTGCETPEYTPPPMPPVKPPKEKENSTLYGLKLYIPFEELNQYIHERVEDVYKEHTFIPVKVEVNDVTLDIDISLLSVTPIDCDKRYKLDLNQLPKENSDLL